MAVFGILAMLLAYLLVKVYQSSSLLVEASKKSFAQETKTQAAKLDGYFERIRSDVENLAKNRAIRAYFQNRALGMSLEYGLSVAVAEVRYEFDRFQRTLSAKGLQALDRIILVDSRDMSEIVQTNGQASSKSVGLAHVANAIKDAFNFPVFTVIGRSESWDVFVMSRVTYKSEVKGFLLAGLNMDAITSQVEATNPLGDEFYLVVNSDGTIFVGPQEYLGRNMLDTFGFSPASLRQSSVSKTQKKTKNNVKVDLIAAGDQIPGTPFYLVRFAPSHNYLGGYSTELWLMVFSALIAGLVIMMLFIYRSWLEQGKTYAQLQEARNTLEERVTERTSELAETNQLLEKEILVRSNAEESLRLSESRYRDLFEHASDLIFTIDLDGNFNSVNGVVKNVLGYSPEEFAKSNLNSVIDIQSSTGANEKCFGSSMNDVDYSAPFEVLARSKSGAAVWLEVASRLMFEGGDRVGVHCIARDITERKELESAVQEAQMKYRSVVDAFEGLIHITAPDYRIQFANKRLIERTGYDPFDKKCYEVVHGLSQPCSWCSFEKVSAMEIDRREIMSPKDDSWYYVVSSPMTHQDGSISRIFLMHDIDDQKRAEQEQERLKQNLIQAQKMEAVGTLAGGIAHDFNNLLQVIIGYSKLLLQGTDIANKDQENLEKIHKAAHQGAELVKSLLAFGRKALTNLRPVDINEQVEELMDLLQRTIPKMIKVDFKLDEGHPTVHADAGQIKQALMNLALNARDAMPDGGILRIETRRVTVGPEFCKDHIDAKPGDYVMLIFSDTGHGMDQKIQQHIFEPFYTTKEVGKGTGLGLSMVFGMVKQHNGFITLKSEPDHGTEFTIYLPLMAQAVKPAPVYPEVKDVQSAATETILLVDDEEMIRELGVNYLEQIGYRVLSAANGRQMLESFKRNRADIDLVLLDLIMPEMGGEACLRELLKIDPDVKVIVVSGCSSGETSERAVHSGAKAFVSKPYDFEVFMKTIRDVLDQS